MSLALQTTDQAAYDAAVHLIESGVPLFIAHPAPAFPDGGHGDTGYLIPAGWQDTEPDLSILSVWAPGDALCAVMGHAIDGLDIDTQKGGTLGELTPPRSYGLARTPSGGTHDLVAPLRARSRDGLLPGVDYKGGDAGVGHGFLFIAPTAKKSKATDEVGYYQWETPPDLDDLLFTDDDSGNGLRLLVNQGRVNSADGRPEYQGPSYEELGEAHKLQADQYLDDELFDWRVRLGDASGWPEGQTDDKGRGWEALSRDLAWAIAKMAVCPWTRLSEDRAGEMYEKCLPEVMASDPKCRGKWYDGILEKAGALPAAQPPWWMEAVFDQTEVLRTIRQAAQSGFGIPEGLLGVVLGRVLAEVPAHVMLPPVGSFSQASLNLGVALVARSGGGKSSTIKSSRRLLGEIGLDQKMIEEGAGSGEGMIDLFLEEVMEEVDGKMKKSGTFTTKPDPRVVYVVDEVDSLAAAGDRSGSTLNANMRTALTGGMLKTSNSKAGGRYRAVDEDTYRIVVLVGVQPMASGVLLSPHEESRGTPQRFLWVKITDKDATIPEDPPEWPEALNWQPPAWPEQYIEYPDHVRQDLVDFQRRAILELVDGNEGHAMLTRLKVAFALAILHGEVKVSDQWWDLSGMLIARSKDVQRECKSALAKARQEQTYYAVLGQKKAEVRATESVAEDLTETAADKMLTFMQRHPGEEFTWSDVYKRTLRGETRKMLDPDEVREVLRTLAGISMTEREAQGRVAYDLVYTAD